MRPRRDVENQREHRTGAFAPASPHNAGMPWTWHELCFVWDHPDWYASEIARELGRSTKAVRRVRDKYGRFHTGRVPVCAKCGERPVWVESAKARRMGLCESCYIEEERLRLEDRKRNDALRQMRMRDRRRNDEKR